MRANINCPSVLRRLGGLSSIAVIWLGASATSAAAHVRWFIDTENPELLNLPRYSLLDTPVLIWAAIGVVLVSIAVALDGRLPRVPIVPTKLRHDAIELLRVFTGMSLLLTAYTGNLIAPHLDAYGAFGMTLVFLQAIIGIMLISNHLIHHAALLMIVLFFGTMAQFGLVGAFEYVNLIGIALFLFFNYVPNEEWKTALKPYSVDMLRIFTGVALVTLGITEKLSGAMLGQGFLVDFQWNFMPMLGFEWYSDQLFVLSAGAMEVIFGIIMIMGVITRLNTLVIAGFMLTSNIVFLLMGENDNALMELVGHMPIIATAVILLLLGYGQRLKVKNPTLRAQPSAAEPVAAE